MTERAAWSIGGTGTALRACSRLGDDGVFEATKWVTALYLPLWPLGRARYRLIDRRWRFPGQRALWVQVLEALPLRRAEVSRTAALAWVAYPAALWGPTALLSVPGLVLGLPKVAAVGAALSSLWVIPFGLGGLLWVQGQPWPRRGPAARWPALVAALRRSGRRVGAAVGLAGVTMAGGCAPLVFVVERVNGAAAEAALSAAAQSAVFLGGLTAVVGPALWISLAWKGVQNDVQMGDHAGRDRRERPPWP